MIAIYFGSTDEHMGSLTGLMEPDMLNILYGTWLMLKEDLDKLNSVRYPDSFGVTGVRICHNQFFDWFSDTTTGNDYDVVDADLLSEFEEDKTDMSVDGLVVVTYYPNTVSMKVYARFSGDLWESANIPIDFIKRQLP